MLITYPVFIEVCPLYLTPSGANHYHNPLRTKLLMSSMRYLNASLPEKRFINRKK